MSQALALQLKAELDRKKRELCDKSFTGQPRQPKIRGARDGHASQDIDWLRSNKGVEQRSNKDMLSYEDIDAGRSFEKSKAILEQKASIYRRLRRGDKDSLSEGQRAGLLVNFDSDQSDIDSQISSESRAQRSHRDNVSGSSDSESDTSPTNPEDMIKCEDEFGRTVWLSPEKARRLAKSRSRVADVSHSGDMEPIVLRGAEHFPVYNPDPQKLAKLRAERLAEEARPLNVHYDAASEARVKSAAFYNFSNDQNERERQMEELKALRSETERKRELDAGLELSHSTTIRSQEPLMLAAQKRKALLDQRKARISMKSRVDLGKHADK